MPNSAPVRPDPHKFFFHSYRDHRDLHSFPTRRSSDLRRERHRQRAGEGSRDRQGTEDHDHGVRSEEHTSELQSPDHLVCRLLLEKKKMTLPSMTRTLFCRPTRCVSSLAPLTLHGVNSM